MMLGNVLKEKAVDSTAMLSVISGGAGSLTSSGGFGWSIGSSVSHVVGIPGLGYGDFVDEVFNFLSGAGNPTGEFHLPPPNVEYDLSVDVAGQSATFTLYDRWNGIKQVYTVSDGGYAQFDVPLDNTDFSTRGQFNGAGSLGTYSEYL